VIGESHHHKWHCRNAIRYETKYIRLHHFLGIDLFTSHCLHSATVIKNFTIHFWLIIQLPKSSHIIVCERIEHFLPADKKLRNANIADLRKNIANWKSRFAIFFAVLTFFSEHKSSFFPRSIAQVYGTCRLGETDADAAWRGCCVTRRDETRRDAEEITRRSSSRAFRSQ